MSKLATTIAGQVAAKPGLHPAHHNGKQPRDTLPVDTVSPGVVCAP